MLGLVAQLCLTHCDPMNCNPPGSSVHGISQARILEWVDISFSRGSFPDPGIKPRSPALQALSLLFEPLGKYGLLLASWGSHVALVVKNPPANAGDIWDASLIPRSGRSPGRGHGSILQYSCLENPMDREAWQARVMHALVSLNAGWSCLGKHALQCLLWTISIFHSISHSIFQSYLSQWT